jgi:hypothetical protein
VDRCAVAGAGLVLALPGGQGVAALACCDGSYEKLRRSVGACATALGAGSVRTITGALRYERDRAMVRDGLYERARATERDDGLLNWFHAFWL